VLNCCSQVTDRCQNNSIAFIIVILFSKWVHKSLFQMKDINRMQILHLNHYWKKSVGLFFI
jgi:hypothetical protein